MLRNNDKNGINIDNAFSFIQLATSIGQEDLKAYCIHWLGTHYTEWEVKVKSLKNEIKGDDVGLVDLIEKARYPSKSYLDKLELYEIEAREWERNAEEIRKQAKSDGCTLQ